MCASLFPSPLQTSPRCTTLLLSQSIIDLLYLLTFYFVVIQRLFF
jgi:hypothetical protein